MKGINAKRIAALAAGAVLLGSSVVAANVMYQNVELVNDNGQPTVKIVVGSGAQISDGVAAANIASAIANQAYKSSTLKAEVSGTPACTAGGAAGGAGTCEVTDKKVTLNIEVPGVLGNAFQFKTLITDTLDRTLGNRINTLSEDVYNESLTSPDTSQTLSPLRAVYSGYSASNLFRIGGTQFTGFSTQTATDSQAGSNYAYQVEQNFWVGSSADQVKYDSGSSYRQIIASPKVVAYNLKFMGNDFGVPFCTKADEGNTSGNWAWCSTDASNQYRTDNHRLKIPFMGSEWVISSMSYPGTALSSATTVTNGGTVKLAKEAKYDIINVGGELDGGNFKVRLADISVATGAANVHPAILDVLDAAGAVVGQVQVNPGDTYTFTNGGQSIKVHVYRTAPGFTLNAKWAEIAIYTDEITLQDGQRYNLVSSGDPLYNLKVSLLWKNKDYSASTNSTIADSLREIVIWDEDTFIGKKFVAGDSYLFPKQDSAWRMTYNGLDLTDGDYAGVTVNALSSTDYPVSTAGGTTDCGSDGSNRITYNARMIQFKTDGNKFGGTSGDLLGNYALDAFYYDPIGTVNGTAGVLTLNGTQNYSLTNRTLWTSTIFYKPSGYNCYVPRTVTGSAFPTIGSTSLSLAAGNHVRFDTAGADSSAYGAFFFTNATSGIGPVASTADFNGTIVFQEDSGKVNTNSHYPVFLQLPFMAGSDTWRFKSQDSSTANTYYHGIRDASTVFSAFEPTFITERGSKVLSVGTTDYQIKVAKTIAQPQFTFAPSSAEIGSTGTDYVMKEGDSQTLTNGVKITVKKISETVGSCVASSTGGSPSCTATMGTVAAKIMPDNVASVEVTQPYKLTSSLVTTDKMASGAGVVITVGGPMVNSVTEEILKDSPVDFKTNSVVVKEIGSKIVVAGYTADDTMTAAQQFIDGISRK